MLVFVNKQGDNDSIRLQTRVQTLRQFCQGIRDTRRAVPVLTSRLFRSSPIISTKLNLLYCPVGKIASTFMTRYVIAADTPDSYLNPFDIPVSEAPREKCQSLAKIRREADRVDFVKSSLKVLFVREPYSRVFSAFVDKVLAPNPFYWKNWGGQAQKQAHVPVADIGCGQNVTFAQFVRYVAATLYRTDVHLRRVTDECDPCHVGYEVIGHLETLREDVLALSELLNVSTTSLRAVDFKDSAAHDALLDSTDSAFQWQDDVLKCVTAQEMGRRLWRKMQIRGIISFRMDYPFVGENAEGVTSSKFHEAIVQARTESLTLYPEDLPKQKEKALVDAYSSVSMVDMEKLAKVYTNDFLAFGYEMKPSLLFNRSNKQSDIFDVFKKWTL
ncbi:carbohydrate sulfotransferase 11-like [Pomacea canaliculata]|uniref:carbohydrate sulfotransferase 11-like n=1 Tax=Pomacea canaliculata TaxID=400727 RepID=UPI000D731227|nr:carbohydrate sulfotransferase 11-like [Pomacea canaliculata]